MQAGRLQLFLAGALFAVPLILPFLIIDLVSKGTGNGLYFIGLFGIPLAAVVIQIREARAALRVNPDRLVRRVLGSTWAFTGGAVMIVFIAFVPLGRLLGSFDFMEGTSIPGELFFLVFAATFAVITLVTATSILAMVACIRRLGRGPRR